MQITTKKKVAAALGAGAVAVAGSGVAFAYWTTTGTANGTASTQTGLAGFTVAQDTYAGSPLYPGITAQELTGTVKNDDTHSPAKLQQIVATLKAPTGGGTDSTKPACTVADYGFENLATTGGWVISNSDSSHLNDVATLTVNQSLAKDDLATGGPDTYAFNKLGVKMLNASTNQDRCKGATVNVTYDAS
jgi:hypothetical protein